MVNGSQPGHEQAAYHRKGSVPQDRVLYKHAIMLCSLTVCNARPRRPRRLLTQPPTKTTILDLK